MKMIGNNRIKAFVETVCCAPAPYQARLVRPANMLVFKDAGEGRHVITSFIMDIYEQYDIISFPEINGSIEFCPDETDRGLSRVLDQIRDSSVFTTSFEGIVRLDMDKLIPYADEKYVIDFFGKLQDMEHAVFIFFLPAGAHSQARAGKMMNRILKTWPEAGVFPDEAYSFEELADIAMGRLEDMCEIPEDAAVRDGILSYLCSHNCSKVADSLSLADRILLKADYSRSHRPNVLPSTVNNVCQDDTEKRDMEENRNEYRKL